MVAGLTLDGDVSLRVAHGVSFELHVTSNSHLTMSRTAAIELHQVLRPDILVEGSEMLDNPATGPGGLS
jgi:hypothetical protein